MEPNLATLNELCDILQISRSKLYMLIGANEIPYIRVGGVYRFPLDQLEAKWKCNLRRPKKDGNE